LYGLVAKITIQPRGGSLRQAYYKIPQKVEKGMALAASICRPLSGPRFQPHDADAGNGQPALSGGLPIVGGIALCWRGESCFASTREYAFIAIVET